MSDALPRECARCHEFERDYKRLITSEDEWIDSMERDDARVVRCHGWS